MKINSSMVLPNDQIFPEQCEKSGIALHHTVGGTARSTFEYWLSTREMVGTAYIIDRDGTIYEIFNPRFWAWQFGLGWPDQRKVAFEKRFIGIEIASEGGMKEVDGRLYCFDRVSACTARGYEHVYDHKQPYRSFRYFDIYTEAQVTSVIDLIKFLCLEHGIEKATPADYLGYYGQRLAEFHGVLGHANLRWDKSDPNPDSIFWEKVIAECGLKPVDIEDELDALFKLNIAELRILSSPAGSMVKGLLYELQREGRETYVRLHDAVPDGHKVSYTLVHGDPNLVKPLATALGFKDATDMELEVYSE
jgi:hypothetical protein